MLIEQALRSAERRIVVVSPWISEEYARLLREKSDAGVNVSLCVSTSEHLEPLRKREIRPEYAAVLFVGFSLVFFGIAQGVFPTAIAGAALIVFAIYLLVQKTYAVHVSIPEPFVHAKIYVVDDRAYLSSANLTHAGMHENVEFVVEIDDKDTVDRIVKEIQALTHAQN